MHITAVCPFCETSYQVQPSLRGQPIRCPNPMCRKVFTVANDLRVSEDSASGIRSAKRSQAPENGQQSGSVGDMVPILPAERAAGDDASGEASDHVSDVLPLMPAEPVAPQPVEAPSWRDPPPVRPPGARGDHTSNLAPPEAAPVTPAPENVPWWCNTPVPARDPLTRTEPPAPATPRPTRRDPPPAETVSPPSTKPPAEPSPGSGAAKQTIVDTSRDVLDQPRELPPGTWEAPPVRRPGGLAGELPPVREPEALPTDMVADAHAPRVSKRHAWRLIAVILLVVAGALGGGGWLIYQAVHKTEESLFAEAKTEYEQGKYGSAASLFRDLADKFPDSEQAEHYRFLREWCGVCGSLTDAEPADAFEKLDSFLKEHKSDPSMGQYAHDTGQMLLKQTAAFAERNSNPSGPQPLAEAQRIEQLRKTIAGLAPDALTQADGQQIDAALGKVRMAVARWRERQELLGQLRPKDKEGPIAAIQRARLLLRKKDGEAPGFSKDAEIQAAMAELYDAHLASVTYEPRGGSARPKAAAPREDTVPSILFDPLLPTAAPGRAPKDDPIVLALARGVLYALKQSNGEIKWATRVGIDTTVLPERVPASQVSRERILVLSADTQTLSALDTDGNSLWEYHLGQPALGRPVIIKQRAYLAAYDGWVHEIELSAGELVGRYHLGQRLSRGGTREGDTNRIYFPADDSCVYVLDVVQHRCVTILYDGHPSGSLRSEPLVIPPQTEGAPGYLILNQANGLDSMRLRVFELPLQDRNAAPLDLDPPAQISGWTWFEPYHDGEKVVLLSDAGILGVFGIRQAGNRDQALFPWLRPGGLDLSPFLLPPLDTSRVGGAPLARPSRRLRGRSQVVQVQGDDLWVLAHGRLQQVQLRWSDATGPRAVAGWDVPRLLGSPLHRAQSIEDPRTGRSVLFLVTQPLEQQTCVASAVDGEGRILWQRQLGMVCQNEPLSLTPPQGGPTMLLALDQGGGLFALDPSRPHDKGRSLWQSLAAALDDNPLVPPVLLPAPDGHSACEIAVPGKGMSLIVRRVEWVGGERRLRVEQQEVSLASAASGIPDVPVGTPAVVGSQLIVPMADGHLVRLPLPISPEQRSLDPGGPDWRARQAPPNAPGHMLALGGDRFLITDGARGLAVCEWPRGKVWKFLPEGRDPLALELDNRVIAPPLLLPSKSGLAPRVVVGDSAGVLHLLAVRPDGSLQPNQTWDLKERCTAGPFLRVLADGVRIGCVLGQRQLAWLEPTAKEPLWIYRTDDDAIVGQPQVIEDLLVVAHQSGRYVALDLTTGDAKGPGYTLRASAAPAASPTSFGPNRMFTPLSDGTALLLPVDSLRKPKE